jgi:hypothetical protein
VIRRRRINNDSAKRKQIRKEIIEAGTTASLHECITCCHWLITKWIADPIQA